MSVFDREKIKEILKPTVENTHNARNNKDRDIYRNTLDCFSGVFEASVLGITMDEWMELERHRQNQKTMQNSIGLLHQCAMGTIEGVTDLGHGNVLDIRCDEKKIVAEIRNKHNTTKGNYRTKIYEDIEKVLKNNPGYTGYYVEILTSKGKKFNNTFTPSENSDNNSSAVLPSDKKKKKKVVKKTENAKIRHIDIRSFYELLCGNDDAVKELYSLIPELTAEILKESFDIDRDPSIIENHALFQEIFDKAYP